jgi:hypothetical protein
MPGCRADPAIERKKVDGFAFPLGVYPVEPLTPRPGYTMEFEPADGDEAPDYPRAPYAASGDDEDDEDAPAGPSAGLEEWPDRYVFDIVISAERLPALCRTLFTLLPPRIYPILDVLGNDAYREIDPFVSYDLLGLDRFFEHVHRFKDLFFEDGLTGFGAMSDEPFVYVFIDEHKVVTVRVQPELRERVEKILALFDLEPLGPPTGSSPEGAPANSAANPAAGSSVPASGALPPPVPAAADASAHEHRGVLQESADEGLWGAEQIWEYLRDEWKLELNVDTAANEDEEGRPLGVTPFRVVVRVQAEHVKKYAEILLRAENLRQAQELAADVIEEFEPHPAFHELAIREEGVTLEPTIVAADRLMPDEFKALISAMPKSSRHSRAGKAVSDPGEGVEGVVNWRWLE